MTNRYVFKLEVNGEVKELTRAQLQPYMQGPDADLRATCLSGAVPGVWRRWTHPGADVPDPRPRLAQRKHHHAEVQQSHIGA